MQLNTILKNLQIICLAEIKPKNHAQIFFVPGGLV